MTKPSVRTEAIAGVTTFFTMVYIVVVNPSMLSTEGTGMPFSGVLTATVLLAATMTLLMGLYAKIPFAVAPGMGLNAFFTFTLVLGQGIPWPTALGIVFWSGVLFVVLSLTPLRARLARAIPHGLRIGAAAGIGLLLTFLALRNAGFIVPDPVTVVKLGPVKTELLLALAGAAVTLLLLRRKSSLAFLVAMVSVTAVAALLGKIALPSSIVAPPDFESVFLQLDIVGALKLSLVPAIIAFLFTDFFDSLSTFVGVSDAAGLVDEKGEPLGLQRGLLVDAFATLGGGLFGTSPGTAYVESSAGIEMGGRTGLTSVFTALCFVPCLFLAPLAAAVPPYATAPVLLFVGIFMFKGVTRLSMNTMEETVPPFLTLALIPLTFSITQGILWGFISHWALYMLAGRRRELPVEATVLFAMSVLLLGVEYTA